VKQHLGDTAARSKEEALESESSGAAEHSVGAVMGVRSKHGSAPVGSSDFGEGFLVGILVGSGHFGGDGRQPQVTLRMHVRHEALFRWIERNFPGGKLYGPYTHGGRTYFQWMARGEFLKETLIPILERHITPELDTKAHANLVAMKDRYLVRGAAGAARLDRGSLDVPSDERPIRDDDGRPTTPAPRETASRIRSTG
jgi:hypothetical protein